MAAAAAAAAAAQAEGDPEPPGGKRRPHGMLKLYYGLPDPAGEALADAARGDLGGPIDINGPHFDPEIYLTKVGRGRRGAWDTPLCRRGL
uniref:Uncharacterized protein n=1 Tax=Pseudonaja textilis TaxID=8673 RepID=A0A670Z320_PSETE